MERPRSVFTSANPNGAVVHTSRLSLVPASLALARAELADRDEFARLLDAGVPANWPPDSVVDALPLFLGWLEAALDKVGWFGWYARARIKGQTESILVGGGGFFGPPRDGMVQVGYSVLSQFQNRGYATEILTALVRWAFEHLEVVRIAAETEGPNPASERVLLKVGFAIVGPSESGGTKFELRAANDR